MKDEADVVAVEAEAVGEAEMIATRVALHSKSYTVFTSIDSIY